MPMNLAGANALATDVAFRGRVAIAFFWVARGVYAEAAAVPGHEQRLRYAGTVVASNVEDFQRYAGHVATDTLIVRNGPYATQAFVTDEAIIAAVQAMWNTLASVPGG